MDRKQQKRRAPIIEALEPRVLFSADMFGGAVDSPATDDSLATLLDDTAAVLDKQAAQLHKEQTDKARSEPLPEDDDVTSVLAEDSTRIELVFVDTDTPDYQQLVDDVLSASDESRRFEVILLDNDRNGIDQITATLQGYQGVGAIHLISHGADGTVDLGNTQLNNQNLSDYQNQLKSWADYLDANADILFYGCDLAASADGQNLIDEIATLTGADIAASDDLTGHSALGGDWELEYSNGQIDTQIAFSDYAQAAWQGSLSQSLWLSTDANVSSPGADGLASWTEGQVLEFSGATLAHGDATDGEFSIVIDFDTFTLDAVDAGALHFVSHDMTVGGVNGTFDLKAGDVLVSFLQDETILAAYSSTGSDMLVGDQDLLVFRPNAFNDYSAGTFSVLLDEVVADDLKGVTLIEQDTTIGGTDISAGSFLLISEVSGTTSIDLFVPTGVGAATTTGTVTPLIDLSGLGIDPDMLRGIEVIEAATSIGGQSLAKGDILATLRANDGAVGSNGLAVDLNDVFVLSLTSTGMGTTAGTATMFLDGSDVGLDNNPSTESPYALALYNYSQLTVDTTSDVSDGDTSSIEALLLNKGADGKISLREAIEAANATPNGDIADVIRFNITDALVNGAHTIALGSALPTISDTLVIDGTSEPDFSGTPVIRIDGASAGANVDGLSFSGTSDNSIVRGLMITGFTRDGILVQSGADYLTFTGNWIGTSGTGSTGVGNGDDGIELRGSHATIGGIGPNEGNVITNAGDEGIQISGTGVTAHLIQGNYIGLDPDGASGSGNSDVGIAIISGSGNTIGGTTASARNVIANNFEGIEVNTSNNVFQGNYIGTDAGGTLDRGNRSDDGIEIQSGATGNLIGGTETGAGNLIAFNALDGVNIVNGSGNTVLGNLIHSNGDLGIDLGNSGVTSNDTNDGDSGANNLQNYPTIITAELNGSNLTLSGTLDTNGVSTSYRIEFFGNAVGTQDATHGEGRFFLGSTTVTTDVNGDGAFTGVTLGGVTLGEGDYVTATATRIDDSGQVGSNDQLAYGDTSEFAANVAITGSNIAPEVTASAGSTGYSEQETAVVIDPSVALVDPDGFDGADPSSQYVGVVEITGNYTVDDVLGFTNTSKIQGDLVGNRLTLSVITGQSATVAEFEAALQSVTFYNGSDNPSELDRSISFSFYDGVDRSNVATKIVQVTGINDAPTDLITTATSQSGISLNEDGNDAYLVADNGLPSPLNQFTVEVQFTGNSFSNEVPFISYNTAAGDMLTINTMANNTLELDIGTGAVAFSSAINYNATLMDGQRHTLSVSWDNTAGDWSVYIDGALIDSGTGLSTGQTIPTGGTLMFGLEQDSVGGGFESHEYFNGELYDIRLFDDVRTATEVATHYTETLPSNEPGMVANWIFDNLSSSGTIVESVGGNNLTVQHTSGTGFTPSNPELILSSPEISPNGTVVGTLSTIDPDSGDSFNYTLLDNAGGRFDIDSVSGDITVLDASLIDYETAASHDITVRVTDASGLSYDEIFTIQVVDTNDAPEGASIEGGALAYTENDGAVAITSTLTISDVDDTNIESAVVQITTGYNSSEDVLSFIDQNGITGSYNATTGTWTLTGTATLGQYETALRSITYSNSSENPDTTTRTVSFTVNDGDANSNTQTRDINITAATDLTAQDDSFSVDEDTTLTGTVASNDSTTSGGSLSYAVNTDVTNGSLTLNADGSFTYTPTANYHGSDSFTYTVTDAGSGESSTQTVAITVNPINDNAVFGGATSGSGDEDTVISGTLTVTDSADGMTSPNYTVTTDGANGTASIDASGNWSYTPTANWSGSDSFTVSVTDDDGHVESQVIAITVNPVGDLTATDDSFTLNEDAVLTNTVATNDSTTSGGALSYALASGVSNGSLTLNADGSFTYTPTANYHGSDSFTYTVTDAGSGESSTQTVAITVNPINDTAVFGGATSGSGDEDTVISGTLTVSDSADGMTSPNYTVTTDGVNGTASIDASGNWSYTPTANWSGSDSFTVSVTDDDGHVESQVIAITVNPVGDLTATDDSFTLNEDTTLNDTVATNDSTTSGGSLSYAVTTDVTNGSLTLNADGSFTYTPTANYHGSDGFTYTVTDANSGESSTQTVAITVNPINDNAVFGGATSGSGDEDTVISGTLTVSDSADGMTSPNYTVTTDGVNGMASIDAAGNWSYTPTANWSGSDSFTVSVTDDDGHVESQVIAITVNPVGDLTATDDSFSVDEDTILTNTVATNDSTTSGGALSYAVTTDVTNGSLTLNADGSFTYTPTANYHGSDGFTYTVTDANSGESSTQTVAITVNPINDNAVFGGATSGSGDEDTVISGTLTVSDSADGMTTPNYTVTADGVNGTASIDAAGNWSYTPTANWSGSDSFTVSVTDDDGHVESQVIAITVNPVGDLTATDDSFTLDEDSVLTNTVAANDSTTSGGALSYAVTTDVTNGSLTLNADGSFTYTPTANYHGSDSFTYTVTDAGSGESATRTVSLTISSVDDAVTIGGDTSGGGAEDTAISGTLAASDSADGLTDGTYFTVSTDATSGTASIDPATGLWSYTPAADFNGSDSFTVTVTDDDGYTATQVVSVTVTPVVDIVDDSLTTNEDTAISANLLTGTNGASDDNFEGTPSLTAVTNGSNGSVSFLADGTVTYTPNTNFNGSDSFTYTITSGGVTETGTVNVTVNSVDDAAVITGDTSYSGNEGDAVSGDLNATDVDGLTDGTYFTVSAGATNGTAAIDSATGAWTFTPSDANWFGTDQFTVTVTDDEGGTTEQIVSITLANVDDAAVITGDTSFSGNEGDTVSGELNATDVDGLTDGSYFTVTGAATNGTAAIDSASGAWTFTPTDANWFGTDQFTVTVTDDLGSTTEQLVSITLTNVNDAPIGLVTITGTAVAGETLNASNTLTDADGMGPVSYVWKADGVQVGAGTTYTLTQAEVGKIVTLEARYTDGEGFAEVAASFATTAVVERPQLEPALNPELEFEPELEPEPEPEVEPDPETEAELDSEAEPKPKQLQGPGSVAVGAERLLSIDDDVLAQVLTNVFAVTEGYDYPSKAYKVVLPKTLDLLNLDLTPFQPESNEFFELVSPTNNASLANGLDQMKRDLDDIALAEDKNKMFKTEAMLGATMGLSAGFISWVLRAGSLMAGFMSITPLWRQLDPMPILGGTEKKDLNKDVEDEASEGGRSVEEIFADEDSDR